jgi:hypothetical protein
MKLTIFFFFLIFIINKSTQQEEIITGLVSDQAKDLAKKVVKTIEDYCMIDNDCVKGFFTIKNYCCVDKIISQCCNVLDFVFTDGQLDKDRLNRAINTPRPINLILFFMFIIFLFTAFLFCFDLFCREFCCYCFLTPKIKYVNFQNPNNVDTRPMLDA